MDRTFGTGPCKACCPQHALIARCIVSKIALVAPVVPESESIRTFRRVQGFRLTIVGNSGEKGNDKFATAAGLSVVCPHLCMLPEDASVFLMQADHIGQHDCIACRAYGRRDEIPSAPCRIRMLLQICSE